MLSRSRCSLAAGSPRSFLLMALTGLAALALSASAASAATITTTGTYLELSDGGGFAASNGPAELGSASGSFSSLVGAAAFDPSLGTLNSVTITADIEWFSQADVSAGEIFDEMQPHSVDVNLGQSPEIGLFRGDVNASLGGVISDFTFFAGDCYGFDDAPCYDSFGDGNLLSGETPLFVDLDDFIGTGDLDNLHIGIFIALQPEFTLDNVDDGFLDLFVDVTTGSVSITYDYTPIPEPGTAALLGLGLIGLSARRTAARD